MVKYIKRVRQNSWSLALNYVQAQAPSFQEHGRYRVHIARTAIAFRFGGRGGVQKAPGQACAGLCSFRGSLRWATRSPLLEHAATRSPRMESQKALQMPTAVIHSPNCHGRLDMHGPISSNCANQQDNSDETNVHMVATTLGLQA